MRNLLVQPDVNAQGNYCYQNPDDLHRVDVATEPKVGERGGEPRPNQVRHRNSQGAQPLAGPWHNNEGSKLNQNDPKDHCAPQIIVHEQMISNESDGCSRAGMESKIHSENQERDWSR